MKLPSTLFIIATTILGCGPSKPPIVGERLIKDEIVTSLDSVAILEITRTKRGEDRTLFKVPTNSLNKKNFLNELSREQITSAKSLIEKIRTYMPTASDLNNADFFMIVGKKSRSSVYILRSKKEEWSFVYCVDI
jgi:hypothetical protein